MELVRYRLFFEQFDKHKRGFLDYDEFQQFLEELGRKDMTDEQRDKCFIFVNKAENGCVSFDEFADGMEALYGCNFNPELNEHQMSLLQPAPETPKIPKHLADWSHTDTIVNTTEKLSELFEKIKKVGRGTSGEVFQSRVKSTGQIIALKVIDIEATEDDIEEIQREIMLQKQFDHPNITKYLGSYLDGRELLITMEYMGAGSLSDLIKIVKLTEEQVQYIVHGIVMGLKCLHDRQIAHRDVKAGNILLSEAGEVKLADFGVASEARLSRRTFAGSPLWIAPEIILQEPYSIKVDIWSLGITCIELALGKPPMSDLHPYRVLVLIPQNEPPKLEGNFSANFKDFVSRCLRKKPDERWSVDQLLEHPFMQLPANSPLGKLLHDPIQQVLRYRDSNRSAVEDVKTRAMKATTDELTELPEVDQIGHQSDPALADLKEVLTKHKLIDHLAKLQKHGIASVKDFLLLTSDSVDEMKDLDEKVRSAILDAIDTEMESRVSSKGALSKTPGRRSSLAGIFGRSPSIGSKSLSPAALLVPPLLKVSTSPDQRSPSSGTASPSTPIQKNNHAHRLNDAMNFVANAINSLDVDESGDGDKTPTQTLSGEITPTEVTTPTKHAHHLVAPTVNGGSGSGSSSRSASNNSSARPSMDVDRSSVKEVSPISPVPPTANSRSYVGKEVSPTSPMPHGAHTKHHGLTAPVTASISTPSSSSASSSSTKGDEDDDLPPPPPLVTVTVQSPVSPTGQSVGASTTASLTSSPTSIRPSTSLVALSDAAKSTSLSPAVDTNGRKKGGDGMVARASTTKRTSGAVGSKSASLRKDSKQADDILIGDTSSPLSPDGNRIPDNSSPSSKTQVKAGTVAARGAKKRQPIGSASSSAINSSQAFESSGVAASIGPAAGARARKSDNLNAPTDAQVRRTRTIATKSRPSLDDAARSQGLAGLFLPISRDTGVSSLPSTQSSSAIMAQPVDPQKAQAAAIKSLLDSNTADSSSFTGSSSRDLLLSSASGKLQATNELDEMKFFKAMSRSSRLQLSPLLATLNELMATEVIVLLLVG